MDYTCQTFYFSDIGCLRIVGTQQAIEVVAFVETPGRESECLPNPLNKCIQQLDEYFQGKRRTFSLNLQPSGTYFQQQVWQQLASVPFGETITYRQIANQIKRPKAYRAVGTANGANPISIILPCHRVLGEDGKLRGYGGGLWRKAWLLAHERRIYEHFT